MGIFNNKLIDIEEKILQMEALLFELEKELQSCSSNQKKDPNLKVLFKMQNELFQLKKQLNLDD